MHGLASLIIFGGVGYVVMKQWAIFVELRGLFDELRSFMPQDREEYEGIDEDYTELIANGDVTRQLQEYISANAHVAPNFDIVKDIVERCSEEISGRVRTLLSIPLYYGLCGTILGIILGLLPLALSSEGLMDNIPFLLGGVAIAMTGSLVGVVLTTRAHIVYKEAITQHEASKRVFFNWFQVSQLPVLGNNPAGPIGQLIRSLSSFNEEFAQSAGVMSQTAEDIAQTFDSQRELLILMRDFTSSHVIQQNLDLARQMTQHVDVVRSFNASILGMQNYVEKLQVVTQELQSSAEYLKVSQDLVQVLNSEKQAIERATGGLAEHIRTMYNNQQEITNYSLETIRQQSEQVVHDFSHQMDRVVATLAEHLEQSSTLPTTIQEMGKLPSVMETLHSEIVRISDGQRDLSAQIATMSLALRELSKSLEKKKQTRSNPIEQEPRSQSQLQSQSTTYIAPPLEDQSVSEPFADASTSKRGGLWQRFTSLFRGKKQAKAKASESVQKIEQREQHGI